MLHIHHCVCSWRVPVLPFEIRKICPYSESALIFLNGSRGTFFPPRWNYSFSSRHLEVPLTCSFSSSVWKGGCPGTAGGEGHPSSPRLNPSVLLVTGTSLLASFRFPIRKIRAHSVHLYFLPLQHLHPNYCF